MAQISIGEPINNKESVENFEDTNDLSGRRDVEPLYHRRVCH